MSFIYDYSSNSSEFVMWDAQSMSSVPIVRAKIGNNIRVPNGFHAYFV